jgi:5-methylcytosine-specific restriction endonuclease McrA
MAETKRCAKCGNDLPLTAFNKDRSRRDGLFPYCRACRTGVAKADYAKHRDKRSAVAKAKYAADPEPWKARRRKRYYEDPARAVAEATAWNRANKDRRKVIEKKWRDANMQGLVREAVRRRAATRKGAPALYFTPDQLAARAAYYGHRCWMCRAPMTEWDHVKPLTRGGWHCLSNLRPACRTCNASKRNKWPLAG